MKRQHFESLEMYGTLLRSHIPEEITDNLNNPLSNNDSSEGNNVLIGNSNNIYDTCVIPLNQVNCIKSAIPNRVTELLNNNHGDDIINDNNFEDLDYLLNENVTETSKNFMDIVFAAALPVSSNGLDLFISYHSVFQNALLSTVKLSNALSNLLEFNLNLKSSTQNIKFKNIIENVNFRSAAQNLSSLTDTIPELETYSFHINRNIFLNSFDKLKQLSQTDRRSPIDSISFDSLKSSKAESQYHNTVHMLPSNNSSVDGFEEGFRGEDGQWYRRPDVYESCLKELCNLNSFASQVGLEKVLVPYSKNVCFSLGEGGRELLRACLNTKGCKGRQLQGASVPALLQLAHEWGLWNVALRIRIERHTGKLSPKHEAFVKFKAIQSHLRKSLKREQMHTERDRRGQITDIRFEEMKHLTLGKEGRERLRTELRRLHDREPYRMEDLLEKYGFRYSELRNATVPQLLKMAYICCMWHEVVDACKKQEAKKETKNKKEAKIYNFIESDAKQLHCSAGSKTLTYQNIENQSVLEQLDMLNKKKYNSNFIN